MNTRSFALSALIAGVVIGFLTNLPLLNLINCFLCIWVWVGGFLAVFLYQRFQHGEGNLTAGQGVGLGALSGLIGAFVGLVVYAATSFISIPLFNSLAHTLNVGGDYPFGHTNLSSVLTSAFIFFVLNAVLFPLFGAISGWISATLLKKPKTTS